MKSGVHNIADAFLDSIITCEPNDLVEKAQAQGTSVSIPLCHCNTHLSGMMERLNSGRQC